MPLPTYSKLNAKGARLLWTPSISSYTNGAWRQPPQAHRQSRWPRRLLKPKQVYIDDGILVLPNFMTDWVLAILGIG